MSGLSEAKIMALDYAAVGRRIKHKRKELHLTQEQLSEMVGLSIPHLSHIETGKTKVGLNSLVLIANSLKTSVDSLLYDSLDIMLQAYDKDFKDLLSDCTVRERSALYENAKLLKEILKQT